MSPWVDPTATVRPTQVMRNRHEADAEHEIPPARQRRHRRTREEARATQQAYNDQHQHQHQQEVVVPEQSFQVPQQDFPQHQVEQGGFMGLEGLDLDDLNWDQIQNAFCEFGGVGGTGDGGGYDHSMPAQPPSGGGYDGLVTGTTYPSGGGYEGGMIGTTYLSGGGYDGGMSSTTYLSGGGYVGGMSSTTYPSGGGYVGGDDLDLNLSLRPSEQSAVVDGSQGVYRTPEQERRRLTRPVGRRDSNLHVRPTQGIGFGTRPRRIFSPEATDEDD